MPYQLGSAPPGLRGFLLSRANQQAETQSQLATMQGVLGLHGLLMKQQMAPLEMELLKARIAESKSKSELPGLITNFYEGQTPTTNGGSSTPSDRVMAELRFIEQISIRDPQRGAALREIWKLRNPEIKYEYGIPVDPRTGPRTDMPTIPRTVSGEGTGTPVFNPVTKQWEIAATPGAEQQFRSRQRIEQEERARFDLQTRPPLAPGLPPTYESRLNLIPGATPQAAPPPTPPRSVIQQPDPFFSGPGNQVPPADPRVAANLDAGRTPSGAPGIPTAAVVPNAAGMTPLDKAGVGAMEKAADETGKSDAKRVAELEQKIPNLNSTLRRLDRLQALAGNDQTYAAAGAELKLQLNSIAQAFGIKVDPKKAANTEEYIAHVAELLKERLGSKDYGSGTGVSNVDLVAAGKPLPEVMRTPQGRVQIINALRADVTRSLKDSQSARDYFRKNLSLKDFRFPSELDSQIQQTRPGQQSPVNNDPLGLFK